VIDKNKLLMEWDMDLYAKKR